MVVVSYRSRVRPLFPRGRGREARVGWDCTGGMMGLTQPVERGRGDEDCGGGIEVEDRGRESRVGGLGARSESREMRLK